MTDRVRSGRAAERAAERALRRAGYRVLARNWRCGIGELDLVARDGDELVFVEVKAKSTDEFGAPGAMLTPRKRRQIARAAAAYLAAKKITSAPCRFDVVVVALEGGGPGAGPPRPGAVEILKAAFTTDDAPGYRQE